MKIQQNYTQPVFNGHGVQNFKQVMNRLYKEAYETGFYEELPDMLQVSAKMKNGKNITADIGFCRGKYVGMSLPEHLEKYRSEFCETVFQKFNAAITKGKWNK